MMRLSRWSSLLLVALASTGCSHDSRSRFPSAESPLELERVVLYRNGIGYFERSGTIDGNVLTLKVRKDQINDLLKSLTVVERKSGRAVSVSMPLDPQSWANAALATLQPGRGNLAEVLDALRGTEVTLSTSDGTLSGRIVMVEPLEEAPSETNGLRPMPAPTRDHRITLLEGDALRVTKLSRVKGVRFSDGDLAMQFGRTLDASAGEGMFQQVQVSIRLEGASSHDLLVSYVAAAPMWKPTYRVVLPKAGKGTALLQGWAVVDNTSGEDWSQVALGLTSGAPIAFRYDLHTPRDVARSDLTEVGVHRQAAVMMGETSYEEAEAEPMAPAGAAAPSVAWGAFNNETDEAEAKPRADRRPEPRKKLAEAYGEALEDRLDRPALDLESLRRSTQSQARASAVSGLTRFDLEGKVTVPEGTSTMVAIVNSEVEGEETFLFRPGGAGLGYEANPYRVVRFKNTTPFVLEPGPISIFAGGSFVGEGLSETVGAGSSATVPFAVETGLMVSSVNKDDRESMQLVKLSRGVLEVEQFARRTTTYTVKAQTLDTGFTLLVRHPKTGFNYELSERPEGTEDLIDGYLVKVTVAPGQREGSLTLREQTPSRTTLSIWSKPALELLEKLLIHVELTPELKKRLQPIVDGRREIGRLDEQLEGLTQKRNQLDQRSNELRENLRSIEKNQQATPQRQKWTRQLDEFTSEGNKLGAQLAELEAKRLDKRMELEDLLQGLEVEPPKPKK